MDDELAVLLVDEEPEVRDLTRTFLERSDDALSVSTAESASAALDRVGSGSFDCVVTDFSMPEMDGVTLAEELDTRGVEVPVVLYTGRAEEEFSDRVASTPVAGVVTKGAGTDQYDELARRIRAATD